MVSVRSTWTQDLCESGLAALIDPRNSITIGMHYDKTEAGFVSEWDLAVHLSMIIFQWSTVVTTPQTCAAISHCRIMKVTFWESFFFCEKMLKENVYFGVGFTCKSPEALPQRSLTEKLTYDLWLAFVSRLIVSRRNDVTSAFGLSLTHLFDEVLENLALTPPQSSSHRIYELYWTCFEAISNQWKRRCKLAEALLLPDLGHIGLQPQINKNETS